MKTYIKKRNCAATLSLHKGSRERVVATDILIKHRGYIAYRYQHAMVQSHESTYTSSSPQWQSKDKSDAGVKSISAYSIKNTGPLHLITLFHHKGNQYTGFTPFDKEVSTTIHPLADNLFINCFPTTLSEFQFHNQLFNKIYFYNLPTSKGHYSHIL